MPEYELTENAKSALRTLSVILYVISLFLLTGAGLGVICLLMGWFELLASPLQGIAWLANPALFAAWLLISARRRAAARTLSIVALALGISWMFHHDAITNEGGSPETVPLKVGYWVWLISLMLSVISAFAAVRNVDETQR